MRSFLFHIRIYLILFVSPFYLLAQPTGYYNGTEGLSGEMLKTALHEIIDNHYFGENWYNDAKYIFLTSDADPDISGNIIDVYSGNSMNGLNYGTQEGTLNREHVWAKSHGGFAESSPMYSDYHNLKPCESRINQNRGNLDFDWGGTPHPTAIGCFYDSDSWEPRDAVKGDIARIIFYMSTRYEGTAGELDLEVADWVGTYPMPKHGKLSALFAWNLSDPPDDFERNRNNVIYSVQGNRNPFIDHPEWISMIWGSVTPSDITIGNIQQHPILPTSEESVEITCSIENISNTATVQISWGTSYTELINTALMTKNGDIWHGIIPAQSPTKIYYTIRVTDLEETVTSINYNYLVADIMSISEIQGTESESPYIGQSVQTTGVVTATFQNGFTIQDGTDVRSGIFVYDYNQKPVIGNLIMVEGTVSEYFGLTELSNITNYLLLQNTSNIPNPISLTSLEIGEDYESMLVSVRGTCIQYATNNYWKIADETGEISIHNNFYYIITPAMNQFYHVNGILTVSDYGWFVELYDYQVSINELENASDLITIFPNPASERIFLKTKNDLKIYKIDIFDIAGKLHKTAINTNVDFLEMDVSSLASGIWFLRFYGQDEMFIKKFIKN